MPKMLQVYYLLSSCSQSRAWTTEAGGQLLMGKTGLFVTVGVEIEAVDCTALQMSDSHN